MYFLNVLFGGYFGSRLMQNIREEKGFTYGIGSGLVSFQHDGYMGIASEVKKEVAEQAVEEVFKEMKRLQTEKAAEDEMETVRNYIMGRLLRDFNGPFAQASRLRAVVPYGLGNDFYQNLSRTIQAISPTQLMELANKYLQADEMTVVIAGDK